MGSDLDEYVNEVERILEEKINSIIGIKSLIDIFKMNLEEEWKLNEWIFKGQNFVPVNSNSTCSITNNS